MSDKHLQHNPHQIRGVANVWWYEEPRGMELIVERVGMSTQHVTIPWYVVRFALARKDKK